MVRLKGIATDQAIESLLESKNVHGFPIHIIDDLEEACKLVGEMAKRGVRDNEMRSKAKNKKMQEQAFQNMLKYKNEQRVMESSFSQAEIKSGHQLFSSRQGNNKDQ